MAKPVLTAGVQNNPDATPFNARGSKYGAAIDTNLHGKYGELAIRGQVFSGSTVIAGVVIPVAAATLNSKFTLHNPAASGKNIELISFHLGSNAATTVVNGLGLMIQRNLAGSGGVPTSVTVANSLALGIGGTASGVFATQATLTNVAIAGVIAGTPAFAYYNMFTFGAVTAAIGVELTHNFDGRVWLAPDSLVAAVASVAASQACVLNIVWAEHAA